MADFTDYFHFADDGEGVDAGCVDGVFKEFVAVLEDGVLDIDGVFAAISEFVLKDKDAVVLYIAQIEGVGTNLANELSGLLCASAPDEGAEGDKRKDGSKIVFHLSLRFKGLQVSGFKFQ